MEQSRAWVQALRENIGKVLVGKDETINLVLTTLAAGGHVLLEDVPEKPVHQPLRRAGNRKDHAGKIAGKILRC